MSVSITDRVPQASGDFPYTLFNRLIFERELTYVTKLDVASATNGPDAVDSLGGWVVKFSFFEDDDDQMTLWVHPDKATILYMRKQSGMHTFVFAGTSKEELEALYNDLSAAIPSYERKKKPADNTVPVHFWTMTQRDQAQNVARRLDVPTWGEIAANYPPAVSGALGKLTSIIMPQEDVGKLILWDGPPGGGKSFALRSLCREWKRWVDIHYITDPERFFGMSEYMMSVLLTGNNYVELNDDNNEDPVRARIKKLFSVPDELLPADPFDPDEEQFDVQPERQFKYKLLILEDAGEFLRTDAQLRQGQNLSRLLNITDGMLGQGLKFITLITTNEELKLLHQAVVREGRCLAHVHFNMFTQAEGNAWLAAKGSDRKVPAEKLKVSLGELYAILLDARQITTDTPEAQAGQYL